jgi:hypothetical protein
MLLPLPLFAFLPEGAWVVPVVGGAVCGIAFLLGRRVLSKNPTDDVVVDPDGPLDATFLKGVTQDRRCAPRRKGNTVEVELSDGSDAPPVRGWVRDRSIGGLCLLADQAIAEGAVLKVRPVTSGPTIPWTDITVRSCRADGGQYELGCQFHRTPNWNQLLKFG